MLSVADTSASYPVRRRLRRKMDRKSRELRRSGRPKSVRPMQLARVGNCKCRKARGQFRALNFSTSVRERLNPLSLRAMLTTRTIPTSCPSERDQVTNQVTTSTLLTLGPRWPDSVIRNAPRVSIVQGCQSRGCRFCKCPANAAIGPLWLIASVTVGRSGD